VTALCFNSADKAEQEMEYRILCPCLWFHLGEVVRCELDIFAEKAERPDPGKGASKNASPIGNEEPLIFEVVSLTLARNILLVNLRLHTSNVSD